MDIKEIKNLLDNAANKRNRANGSVGAIKSHLSFSGQDSMNMA